MQINPLQNIYQSLATILKIQDMDPIKDGDKIFTQIAKSFDWTETQSLEQVSLFLDKLIKSTNRL